ncbi:Crp/Fnr family transcriptional regulator [Marinobacter nanhaiticus D15-8W]|uniref:Crp/Fnr family transcriptional regulator n=1 Tax=Marinobacter nanhaiticus D15-8W TaxID=626887 RepID=N6WRA2_9GAMM|nr:Crp/Fnr family transcriptional regulator [Marinobacter nanhaiticus]ENO14106.1 Crp/Fnr family transcriptional regulator [Marinobacter nanhaiticus D15-8W]BES71487.1 Crp/Fnr family transcriptional regulator [Marinobacter nanhaiticus D15-8W]
MTILTSFNDPLLTPLLHRLSAYAPISASDKQRLNQLIHSKKMFSRGDFILETGQTSDKVFAIAKGWAAHEVVTEEGDVCILGFLLPGDASTFNSQLNAASYVSIKCLTEVWAISFQADALRKLLTDSATLTRAFSLMRMTSESIDRELIVNLLAKPADYKIASLLCELGVRDGRGQPDSPITRTIPLSQVAIGAALGLSSVHVNRVISRMQQEGLLKVQHGFIHITNWELMTQTYRFDSAYMTRYDVNHHKRAPTPPARLVPLSY